MGSNLTESSSHWVLLLGPCATGVLRPAWKPGATWRAYGSLAPKARYFVHTRPMPNGQQENGLSVSQLFCSHLSNSIGGRAWELCHWAVFIFIFEVEICTWSHLIRVKSDESYWELRITTLATSTCAFCIRVWARLKRRTTTCRSSCMNTMNNYSWMWNTTDIKEPAMRSPIWSHLIDCWSILSGAIWAVLKSLRCHQPSKLPADELFIYSRLPAVSYIGNKIGLVWKQHGDRLLIFFNVLTTQTALTYN